MELVGRYRCQARFPKGELGAKRFALAFIAAAMIVGSVIPARAQHNHGKGKGSDKKPAAICPVMKTKI